MKKFIFRLEKIFKHKERLYDIARGAHSEALHSLRKEEATLHRLHEDYSQCLSALAEKMKTNFQVKELGPFYRYMTFTKKEIAAQSTVVCEAISIEEKKRQELMKAAQEKEALVKLRQKQYEEYMYALSREEQAFLDDLNSAKYVRSMRENRTA
jgi:flagellar protein FliJ